MILKSYIIEQNFKILDNYKSLLIFGENRGLIDDLKKNIKKNNAAAETINLFQDEILKKEKILSDEINNTSLFCEKKIIFIHESTDKIFNQFNNNADMLSEENKIIIISGLLDRKSKLRNLFEKSKDYAVVPCYKDNERTLSTYIKNNLTNVKGISQQVVNLIIENSDLDRKTICNELEKIKMYCIKKEVNLDIVKELLNIKSNTEFDQIRDASLTGDKKKVNKLLGEIEFRNEDIVFYINSLNTRITKLHEIHSINESIKDLDVSLEELKPKIFWKDKPIILDQLKRWNISKLQQILIKVADVELNFKSNFNNKSDLILKDLLIKICSLARINSS